MKVVIKKRVNRKVKNSKKKRNPNQKENRKVKNQQQPIKQMTKQCEQYLICLS